MQCEVPYFPAAVVGLGLVWLGGLGGAGLRWLRHHPVHPLEFLILGGLFPHGGVVTSEVRGSGWPGTATAELERLRAEGLWSLGAATTFEVLDVGHLERHHQWMIAWLLNPREAHQLGARMLAAVLRRAGRADLVTGLPLSAEVRKEVVQPPGTRADIVVRTATCTLVVELKVYASEGTDQTRRLVQGYAHEREPVWVFLTLNGEVPRDGQFHSMTLAEFAKDLSHVLDQAPEPHTGHGVTGRATALDYLTTLRRMTGMTALDHEAARFWLTYGAEMTRAEEASWQLLGRMAAGVESRLTRLAAALGPDVIVRTTDYSYQSKIKNVKPYEESAILLTRKSWLDATGGARIGVGFGRRHPKIDAFHNDHKPFVGLFSFDHDLYLALGPVEDAWANRWISWEYADLTPPPEAVDLVEHLLDQVADQMAALWAKNVDRIDAVASTSQPTAAAPSALPFRSGTDCG